jgi:hypothetical protein
VLWQISATSFSGLLPATFTGARLHNALAAPPITAVGAHAGLLVDGRAGALSFAGHGLDGLGVHQVRGSVKVKSPSILKA